MVKGIIVISLSFYAAIDILLTKELQIWKSRRFLVDLLSKLVVIDRLSTISRQTEPKKVDPDLRNN